MKQFRKPSYHIFQTTQLPRYRWRHNLLWPQKLFFQTCLNYTSLGCSLCTDQFLINYHGFRMLGKRDITSVRLGKKFFPSIAIIYHSRGLSLLIIFCWKTMIWKSQRKEIFDILFGSVIRQNLKQGTDEINIIFLSMLKT